MRVAVDAVALFGPRTGVGVFTAKGESLENYGVQPDILVDNTPEDFLLGRDRQIEKALDVLRAEMK